MECQSMMNDISKARSAATWQKLSLARDASVSKASFRIYTALEYAEPTNQVSSRRGSRV